MFYDAELLDDGEPLGEISFDRDNPPRILHINDCADTVLCTYQLIKTEQRNKHME